jgi:hypothetical protein
VNAHDDLSRQVGRVSATICLPALLLIAVAVFAVAPSYRARPAAGGEYKIVDMVALDAELRANLEREQTIIDDAIDQAEELEFADWWRIERKGAER